MLSRTPDFKPDASDVEAHSKSFTDAMDDVTKCLHRVRETFAGLETASVIAQIDRLQADMKLQAAQDLLAETMHIALHLRNTLPPIARLPAEVLVAIFLILQNNVIQDKGPASVVQRERDLVLWHDSAKERRPMKSAKRHSARPFSWMNIMRVCRRWNEVAKACPILWSTLLFDEAHDIAPLPTIRSAGSYPELFLRRSGDVLLRLSLSGSYTSGRHGRDDYHHYGIAHQLLPHVARAEELHFRGSLLHAQAKSLLQPAPHLKALILSHSPEDSPRFKPPVRPFLGGQLSSLRSLAFIDIRISDFAGSLRPSYRQLRQLYILTERFYLDTTKFVAVLRDTPNVEDVFYRERTSRANRVPHVMPKQVVPLPKLKRLTLDHRGENEPVLLSLSLPSGVMLTLKGGDPGPILPNDRSALGDLKDIRRIKLHCGRIFHGSKGHLESCIYAVGERSALQFDRWKNNEASPSCAALMKDIEELWMEGNFGGSPLVAGQCLRNTLLATTRLRSLILNLEDEDEIFEVLEILLEPDHLLSLRSMEIRIPSLTMQILNILQDLLSGRKDAGHTLQVLRLGRHERMLRRSLGLRPKLAYSEWAAAAALVLGGVVGELVFVDGEPVPRMLAPPICHAPSGRWQWSEWGDK